MLNCVVLWNTVYLDAAVTKLRAEGYPVRHEDVARLSAYMREHINVQGHYFFELPDLGGASLPSSETSQAMPMAASAPGNKPGKRWRRMVEVVLGHELIHGVDVALVDLSLFSSGLAISCPPFLTTWLIRETATRGVPPAVHLDVQRSRDDRSS